MKFVILLTLLVNFVVANAENLDYFETGLDYQGLIVGGEKAEPMQFPYQVCLRAHFKKLSGSTLCGGTLISDQWIVTAAHCTEFGFYKLKYINAHLGAWNRTDSSEPGHKVIRVAKENVFNHKDYDRCELLNDMSLLKLPDPIELNEYIQPAKLPRIGDSASYAGEMAIATGWGQRSDSDRTGSDILLWIEVSIMDSVECKSYLKTLKEIHISVNATGKRATCPGDSGGPLVLDDGSKTLIGVTLFGSHCYVSEYPEVFMRLTSYLDWIKNITGIANEEE